MHTLIYFIILSSYLFYNFQFIKNSQPSLNWSPPHLKGQGLPPQHLSMWLPNPHPNA